MHTHFLHTDDTFFMNRHTCIDPCQPCTCLPFGARVTKRGPAPAVYCISVDMLLLYSNDADADDNDDDDDDAAAGDVDAAADDDYADRAVLQSFQSKPDSFLRAS